MHVVPFVTKVVTLGCNKNIIVNDYNQRLYRYNYPVNNNMDINIRHDIWCMNIWLNQPSICSRRINDYMYIHAFITNHIKISMYEFTTNNQHLACSLQVNTFKGSQRLDKKSKLWNSTQQTLISLYSNHINMFNRHSLSYHTIRT